MPKVSVIIPCYNAAATLEETLETIVSQTMTAFEVIAVDDGSEDQTGAILQAWAQRDPRFIVLPVPHGGIIPALNAGIAASQADLIARMDADDKMDAARLKKQSDYLDTHPELALVSSLVNGFPKDTLRKGFKIYIDWLNSLVKHEDISQEIYVESPLCHPSVMFRKQAVLDAGGYQEHGWAEDYDLWLRMHQAGMRFEKIPEVLVAWREHPDRLTRTDSRYSLENFIRAKAHYLALGPLKDRDGVVIWGAGMHGRRLSKHLLRNGVNLSAFIDVDPKKIGRTMRGQPIMTADALPEHLAQFERPAVLAAVGARGARALIRDVLNGFGLVEGRDWWAAA